LFKVPGGNGIAKAVDINDTGDIIGNYYRFGDFVQFIASDPPAITPLPGAFPLFATGLGLLGLLGWRRKRQANAA
jgi:hypothetical protein